MNIQLQPVNSFKIPIDLLSKTVLHTNLGAPTEIEQKKSYWDENGNRQFYTEKFLQCNEESTKCQKLTESKKRNIYSEVTIVNWNDCAVIILEFDFAVLDACITEKLHGNEYTTPNIIFHRLGGGRNLTPKMRKAILDSVEKLSKVRITLNWEDAVKKNIVKDEQKRSTFKGYLLPTESVTLQINGKTIDAIHLLTGGVIINNANIRNQFVTCDTKLLQPPVKTTTQTISINHFFLRRINEIKGSHDKKYAKRVRQLRKTITFEDMYEKIGLDNGTRKQKWDARKTAFKVLDFLVSENILKKYTVKESKESEILALIIDF